MRLAYTTTPHSSTRKPRNPKKKVVEKNNENDNSLTSDDSILVSILEKTIPHKMDMKIPKTIIKGPKQNIKKNEWVVDMELEQNLLIKMNDM